MRKRIAPAVSVSSALRDEQWIDLEGLAQIEVTSESPNHPIEAALLPGNGSGWRADAPGRQSIRILFDSLQPLRLIHLVFVEEHAARTQEFVLRWSDTEDGGMREVVRQQYNLAPVDSEVEDYRVELAGVKLLELEITPEISGGGIASLAEMRVR